MHASHVSKIGMGDRRPYRKIVLRTGEGAPGPRKDELRMNQRPDAPARLCGRCFGRDGRVQYTCRGRLLPLGLPHGSAPGAGTCSRHAQPWHLSPPHPHRHPPQASSTAFATRSTSRSRRCGCCTRSCCSSRPRAAAPRALPRPPRRLRRSGRRLEVGSSEGLRLPAGRNRPQRRRPVRPSRNSRARWRRRRGWRGRQGRGWAPVGRPRNGGTLST